MNIIRGKLYVIINKQRGGSATALCVGHTNSGAACFRLSENIFDYRIAGSYGASDYVNRLVWELDVESYPYWCYSHSTGFDLDGECDVAPINTFIPNASCHCANLLTGHDAHCSYHRADEQRGAGLWGILRSEPKTQAEINAAHRTVGDAGPAKHTAFARTLEKQS